MPKPHKTEEKSYADPVLWMAEGGLYLDLHRSPLSFLNLLLAVARWDIQH